MPPVDETLLQRLVQHGRKGSLGWQRTLDPVYGVDPAEDELFQVNLVDRQRRRGQRPNDVGLHVLHVSHGENLVETTPDGSWLWAGKFLLESQGISSFEGATLYRHRDYRPSSIPKRVTERTIGL